MIAADAPVIFLYAVDIAYGRREEISGVVVHPNEILDLRQARKLPVEAGLRASFEEARV